MKRTKIVCTIGPSSESVEILKKMIISGMDVARLNFSHGSHNGHLKIINNIRKASKRTGKTVAILGDLQGPKIRTGLLKNKEYFLKENSEITLTTRNILGTEKIISTNYKNITKDLKREDLILLDDGMIQLKVKNIEDNNVFCKVIAGGLLKEHKGINLPGVDLSVSSLTKKDVEDLKFCLENDLEYIALSFVRKVEDVKKIKKTISKFKKDTPVIAKLEKPEAVENLEEILDISDGVMIARGDMGVEMELEKVPIMQKKIIEKANEYMIPVITATQMLESMTEHPRPTRAEASDVANAILDGTDAVMLSEETALGEYPLESVKVMSRIIETTEKEFSTQIVKRKIHPEKVLSFPDTVTSAAVYSAEAIRAKAIVAFTQSGFTALLISKSKPYIPVIAFTPYEKIKRKMSLYWGVNPKIMPLIENTDDLIEKVDKLLLKERFVKRGDAIVIILGAPIYEKGTTNLLKLHRI